MEKIKNEQGNPNSGSMLGQKTGSALDKKTNEDFNEQHPDHDNSGLKNTNTQNPDGKNTGNDYKQTSDMKMTATKIENKEATKTYTCSMHPEVISDKPGKCPKCGMELIEKK